MSFDTGGYRPRWTVPCTDLFGQAGRAVIALADDRPALLVALPADAVRMTLRQADELARDLADAARQTRAAGEETESR